MATNKEHIEETYPLPVYNYLVTVENIQVMSFSEISGLTLDYEHILYRDGSSFFMGDKLIRAQRQPINITLRRGVAKQRVYLYDWLKKGDKRDVRIALCDEQGLPIVSWQVMRALPIKLDAPAFNAGTNDAAIESLDLIAHDLTITHHE